MNKKNFHINLSRTSIIFFFYFHTIIVGLPGKQHAFYTINFNR